MILAIIFLLFLATGNVSAQSNSQGLAISLPIVGEGVESGHVICASDVGFILCVLPYDPQVTGVVNDNPAVALSAPGTEGDVTRLVLQDGTAPVIVSGISGPISEGDFVKLPANAPFT